MASFTFTLFFENIDANVAFVRRAVLLELLTQLFLDCSRLFCILFIISIRLGQLPALAVWPSVPQPHLDFGPWVEAYNC